MTRVTQCFTAAAAAFAYWARMEAGYCCAGKSLYEFHEDGKRIWENTLRFLRTWLVVKLAVLV